MTLTQTAVLTKRVLLIFGLAIFLSTVGWISLSYYRAYKRAHTPPVEEKPDVKFGILPQPNFKEASSSSSNYSYNLDTITGGLPQTPKIMRVYFVPQLGTTLLSPDRAKDLANNLNFSDGPLRLSETEYQFSNSQGGKLIIDLSSGNFHFQRGVDISNFPQDDILADQGKLVADFKNYLSHKELLYDLLKNGRSLVTYDSLTQKESSTAAVTIWPDDVDKIPVVTDSLVNGLVKATVTKAKDELGHYRSLDFIYWSPAPDNFSTYPIKTAKEALNDLKSAQATVAVQSPSPQVSITSVKIAYFESEKYSPYLEPVFVFESRDIHGSLQFAAFVPAITSEFLSK